MDFFSGMRILIGYSSPSREQVVRWVTEMGGIALTPMQYKDNTHICFDGIDASSPEAHVWHKDNRKIISKAWIKPCYDDKMLSCDDEDLIKNGTLVSQSQTCSCLHRVKRKLCFDDEDGIFMKHHDLFLCKGGLSSWTTLESYAEQLKATLIRRHVTPGTFKFRPFVSTNPQMKEAVRQVYILIKWLHKGGFSLAGNFTSRNIIIDLEKCRTNARFSVHREELVEANPSTKQLDIKQLKKVVRREVFKGKLLPYDLNLWLSLLSNEEYDELLPHHISLKDELVSMELFMTWYSLLDNLKIERQDDYDTIVANLKACKGWKKMIQDEEGNLFLEETLEYSVGGEPPIDYADDAGGLLYLLRNCRQHSAKSHFEYFLLIVGHIFPNLISDLQIELFKLRLLALPS